MAHREHGVKFSIVIPAHNEEAFIGACLDSIAGAEQPPGVELEIIVVANRCTDRTEAVALSRGAVVIRDGNRNLAKTRNAGARRATGDVLVTIDADSRMSANMLREIADALASGRYVGGGVFIRPERWSAGIGASFLVLRLMLLLTGLSGGLFWCRRRDFDAIGGFNESLLVGEDLDFARRLRARGRLQGRKLHEIRTAHIVTSCRKFDAFGDWLIFRLLLFHGGEILSALRGGDRRFPDRYFYDFNDNRPT
jgi:glycosyltransferase involved in cell wall biosynthesis